MVEAQRESAEAAAAKLRVRRYYQAATDDYLRYYQADWHHHMHYGFDRDLPRGGNPTENLVRYLADVAGVRAGWRVLDLGCGVGGASIWLAGERGCRCLGVTLMEPQARLAAGFARRRGLGEGARFLCADFTRPGLRHGSFDLVWAIESFDHAPDKAAFVARAFGLLRPGGRLLIADGFRAERGFTAAEETSYRKFLAGWAVPHLCTRTELGAWAARAGFRPVHAEDITADIFPHARAIYRFGLIFTPWRKLLRMLGLTSAEKLGNAAATYWQYRTLRAGLWRYAVHCLEKPA